MIGTINNSVLPSNVVTNGGSAIALSLTNTLAVVGDGSVWEEKRILGATFPGTGETNWMMFNPSVRQFELDAPLRFYGDDGPIGSAAGLTGFGAGVINSNNIAAATWQLMTNVPSDIRVRTALVTNSLTISNVMLSARNSAAIRGLAISYTNQFGSNVTINLSAMGWYNVQAYGAKADGVTANNTVVQYVIDVASTNGGGVIYFPRGTYQFDGTSVYGASYQAEGHNNCLSIRSNNIYLVGDGMGQTTLRVNATGLNGNNFIGSLYATNIGFKNMTWDLNSCDTLYDTTQIYYHGLVVFDSVECKNQVFADFVDVQNGTEAIVLNCRSSNIGGNCIGSQVAYLHVIGGEFHGGLNGAFSSAIQDNNTVAFYDNVTVKSPFLYIGGGGYFRSCYFDSTNTTAMTNMTITGAGPVFVNCNFYSASSGGTLFYVTNGGLTLENCSQVNAEGTILRTYNPKSIRMVNNRFGGSAVGIRPIGSATSEPYYWIQGNTFRNNGNAVRMETAPYPGNFRFVGNALWWQAFNVFDTHTNLFLEGNTFYGSTVSLTYPVLGLIQRNTWLNGAKLQFPYGGSQTRIAWNNIPTVQFDNGFSASTTNFFFNNILGSLTGSDLTDATNYSRWAGNVDINLNATPF